MNACGLATGGAPTDQVGRRRLLTGHAVALPADRRLTKEWLLNARELASRGVPSGQVGGRFLIGHAVARSAHR
ncbi:hypothetical protein [Actinomadura luteofluorescens]|uniref:hypothetical protein n=1 Tax=Actinomadura luteofluorescens TaxID=46163 RepID=UPI003D8EB8BC